MNFKSVTLSLFTAVLLAGAGMAPAMAQGAGTPGIDNQQYNIHARINQGVRQGHITQREASRLYKRENEIARREARAKANGRVSASERSALRRDVAALRAEVERKMTNRQTAQRRF
jgi:hypothetical protein